MEMALDPGEPDQPTGRPRRAMTGMHEREVPMRELLSVVRRRMWYLIVPVLGAIIAVVLVAVFVKPLYRGETSLLLDQPAPELVDFSKLEQTALGPQSEEELKRNEVEVIRSRGLARSVVERLKSC